jgi:hypothetical protein
MKIGKKKVKVPSYQLKKPYNSLSTNINLTSGTRDLRTLVAMPL